MGWRRVTGAAGAGDGDGDVLLTVCGCDMMRLAVRCLRPGDG